MRLTDRFRVRGASLLDELTAIVVLSVGLIGLAGLQGRTLGVSAVTQARAVALSLASSQLEMLRAEAGAPGSDAAGYRRIGDQSQTFTELGGQRLPEPFRSEVTVVRYRLADDRSSRYRAMEPGSGTPYDPAIPEFKQVQVTVTWKSGDGKTGTLSVPGIVSPGPF